jgi:hypothetical protein
MTRARWACAAVLVGCLAAWAAAPEKEEALPADLARVPTKGVGFVSVRVADLWAGDLARAVQKGAKREAAEMAEEFRKTIGLAPDEVERLTLVLPGHDADPVVIVMAKKAVPGRKLLATLVPEGKEEKVAGQTLVAERYRAVYLLGETAYAFGGKRDMETLLGTKGQPAGGLTAGLRLAAKKHSVVVGVNVAAAPVPKELPPDFEPFKPLLGASEATLVLDLGEKNSAGLRVVFPTAGKAAAGVKALEAGKKLGLDAAAGIEAQLKKDPNVAPLLRFWTPAEKALKGVTFRREAGVVTARLQVSVEGLSGPLAAAVVKAREAARRLQSVNKLKQLAIAMHNYLSTYGTFPPQAIYGKDGKPLLSWRVAILPFIEQQNLYNQFKLDEPWDSAHNKKLLAKMPEVYRIPDSKPKHPHGTFYQGFVGKSAFFDGKQGLRFPASFADGTSNTIMLVGAAKDVPWTKPEDVPFGPGKLKPLLGEFFPGGYQVLICDGSVRFLAKKISETTLRSAVTPAGGEILGADW